MPFDHGWYLSDCFVGFKKDYPNKKSVNVTEIKSNWESLINIPLNFNREYTYLSSTVIYILYLQKERHLIWKYKKIAKYTLSHLNIPKLEWNW